MADETVTTAERALAGALTPTEKAALIKRWKEEAAANEVKLARDNVIAGIIMDVCDLPDRTSPDDNPDLVTVTVQELHAILESRIPGGSDYEAHQRAARPRSTGKPDNLPRNAQGGE